MISKTAAAQLNRILQLIPELADGQEHRIEEIAKTVGTSREQMMADLTCIGDRFDAPGGFVDAISILVEQHVVSVHTSHFHRPMRLTMAELCALELGLTMLRPERTPIEAQAVDRALVRLRETISNVPSNDRHVGTRYAELASVSSVEHLAVIRRAVCDHVRLRLRYRSGGATKSVDALCRRSASCLQSRCGTWWPPVTMRRIVSFVSIAWSMWRRLMTPSKLMRRLSRESWHQAVRLRPTASGA